MLPAVSDWFLKFPLFFSSSDGRARKRSRKTLNLHLFLIFTSLSSIKNSLALYETTKKQPHDPRSVGGAQLRCILVRLFSVLVFGFVRAARGIFQLPRLKNIINSPFLFSLSQLETKKNRLVGPKVDYAVGYQQFSTALPSPAPIANALLTPLRGAGSKLLEKVGALAAKKMRGGPVGGVGGGSASSTTAAVDGAQQG